MGKADQSEAPPGKRDCCRNLVRAERRDHAGDQPETDQPGERSNQRRP
jgi:hypothetical protein